MKPDALLNPAELPVELKWIASHQKLHPDDPVYLLLGWHAQRTKQAEASDRRVADRNEGVDGSADQGHVSGGRYHQRNQRFAQCSENGSSPGVPRSLLRNLNTT